MLDGLGPPASPGLARADFLSQADKAAAEAADKAKKRAAALARDQDANLLSMAQSLCGMADKKGRGKRAAGRVRKERAEIAFANYADHGHRAALLCPWFT